MGTIVKMCVRCQRLVPLDTLTCSECGGVLFENVDLNSNGEEHNG